jgi:hypothetical protein
MSTSNDQPIDELAVPIRVPSARDAGYVAFEIFGERFGPPATAAALIRAALAEAFVDDVGLTAGGDRVIVPGSMDADQISYPQPRFSGVDDALTDDAQPSPAQREISRLFGMIDQLEVLVDTLESSVAVVLRNELIESIDEPSVAAIQNLSALTEMIQVAGNHVQSTSQRLARIIDRVDV